MATPTPRHSPLPPLLPALLSLLLFPTAQARAEDPPSLTLGSPALRRAAEYLPAPAAAPIDWLASLPLPDFRLRMALEDPLDIRHPSSSFNSLGLRALEVRLPAASGLWLGVEDAPDDPSSPLRATFSLQRDF